MQDYEKFQQVVEDETYMSTLMSSMSLVLEEFYQGIKVVGVSAMTGQGMDKLLVALKEIENERLTEKVNDLKLRRVGIVHLK